MRKRHIAIAAGVAVILSSLAAIASQPEVRITDLAPADRFGSDLPFELLLDPYAASELRIEQPRGFALLDIDSDPFAAVTAR